MNDYTVFSGGRGYARDGDLEAIYEKQQFKARVVEYVQRLSEEQIDDLLLKEDLDPVFEEVIEELFGKTRAKLAGAKAKLGAQAGNLKNRAVTGAQNLGAKAGAYAQNAKNIAQQGKAAMQGQYQTGNLEAGQVDPNSVGNAQAVQTDPNAAANAAKLQSILPQLQKIVVGANQAIDGNLSALGLDFETLKSIDPETAKALSNAKGWLKAAMNKLNKVGGA